MDDPFQLSCTHRFPCPPRPAIPPVNSHKKPVDIPFELAPESQAEQLRLRLAVQKRTERLAIREK